MIPGTSCSPPVRPARRSKTGDFIHRKVGASLVRVISILAGVMLLPTSQIFAQGGTALPRTQSAAPQDDVYAVPGSHLLQQDWQRIGPALNEAANRLQSGVSALRKASAWSFATGNTRNWWATNLTVYTEYAVPSTCRAVGAHCYIFVEDAVWGSRVTQAVVDSLQQAFDSRTPANAAKGIYEMDTDCFGTPPDVDADPKIVILILDIADGFTGSGAYVAGYFYSLNEYSEALVQSQLGSSRHSNEAEIYYVDANPTDLTTSGGLALGATTTAHEFQHMIHFSHDQDEITFVNEGMSETASVLCGYAIRSPSLYYANTNVNFLSWNAIGNILADYSRTAIFSRYIVEQFGSSVTKDIVARPENSIAGYDAALTLHSSSRMFTGVLTDFGIAAWLNDAALDPRFGFTLSITGAPAPHASYSSNVVGTTTESIQPYGTRYVRFSGAAPLCFTCTSAANLSVRAILTGTGASRIDTITLGTPYYTTLAAAYDTAVIAITNLTASAQSYSYNATEELLPVQLSAFDASLRSPEVLLRWTTASEVENLGFAVERRTVSPQGTAWREIAFVAGAGTSSRPNQYSLSDRPQVAGRYAYRLRQVDRSGDFVYSTELEIEFAAPTTVALSQNYPNPFNPTTTIRYTVAAAGEVEGQKTGWRIRLSVYDLLGREVAILVDEEKPAGWHEASLDAAGLASGMYVYQLSAIPLSAAGQRVVETKKLILLR